MIKNFINNIKSIEKNIFNIMIIGIKFSFFILIISCIVALLYILNPISHLLYDSSIILFKTGLTFAVMSFICAFAIDKIKKQLL